MFVEAPTQILINSRADIGAMFMTLSVVVSANTDALGSLGHISLLMLWPGGLDLLVMRLKY